MDAPRLKPAPMGKKRLTTDCDSVDAVAVALGGDVEVCATAKPITPRLAKEYRGNMPGPLSLR